MSLQAYPIIYLSKKKKYVIYFHNIMYLYKYPFFFVFTPTIQICSQLNYINQNQAFLLFCIFKYLISTPFM